MIPTTSAVVVIAVQPADSLEFCHGLCPWRYMIQISAQILSQVKTNSPFDSSWRKENSEVDLLTVTDISDQDLSLLYMYNLKKNNVIK